MREFWPNQFDSQATTIPYKRTVYARPVLWEPIINK